MRVRTSPGQMVLVAGIYTGKFSPSNSVIIKHSLYQYLEDSPTVCF